MVEGESAADAFAVAAVVGIGSESGGARTRDAIAVGYVGRFVEFVVSAKSTAAESVVAESGHFRRYDLEHFVATFRICADSTGSDLCDGWH